MPVQLIDHIQFLVLTLLFPFYTWNETRKYKLKYEQGLIELNLIREYWITMALLWGLCLAVLATWFSLNRPMIALGLNFDIPRLTHFLGACGLALFGLIFAYAQLLLAKRSSDARQAFQTALKEFDYLMPKNNQELRWFFAVSFTAGGCEEILYRSFLIWYLSQFTGPVSALLLSSLAFGLAHSYQGISHVPRTGIVGLFLGSLFLLSGSIWLSILMHFLIDVIGGKTIVIAFEDQNHDAEVAQTPESNT